ncbi:hypothetical protein B0H16DRAFT_1466951 [Mycena metata]|uniref:Uncharacterized protein n=1 Tax=Mycena metata TaxID=1033252 RepID=A0AAD7I685_9AGAR|nr:hypothetical protein B0H16DRAFT_1466951 [Mycena metata]
MQFSLSFVACVLLSAVAALPQDTAVQPATPLKDTIYQPSTGSPLPLTSSPTETRIFWLGPTPPRWPSALSTASPRVGDRGVDSEEDSKTTRKPTSSPWTLNYYFFGALEFPLARGMGLPVPNSLAAPTVSYLSHASTVQERHGGVTGNIPASTSPLTGIEWRRVE